MTTLIALALSWLVIFLLGSKTKDSFEKYQKEKLNSFVLEEKRNKILKLKRELPDLEDEKNSLDSMFVKKDMAVPFLRALEKIAGDTFCRITTEPADLNKIKFEKKSSAASKKEEEDDSDEDKEQDQAKNSEEKNKKEDELAPLKVFPAFSVEVSGHFASVVDFFEKVENMSYFVHPLIVDISLDEKKNAMAINTGAASAGTPASPEGENWDEKNIRMKMTFVVYAQ